MKVSEFLDLIKMDVLPNVLYDKLTGEEKELMRDYREHALSKLFNRATMEAKQRTSDSKTAELAVKAIDDGDFANAIALTERLFNEYMNRDVVL